MHYTSLKYDGWYSDFEDKLIEDAAKIYANFAKLVNKKMKFYDEKYNIEIICPDMNVVRSHKTLRIVVDMHKPEKKVNGFFCKDELLGMHTRLNEALYAKISEFRNYILEDNQHMSHINRNLKDVTKFKDAIEELKKETEYIVRDNVHHCHKNVLCDWSEIREPKLFTSAKSSKFPLGVLAENLDLSECFAQNWIFKDKSLLNAHDKSLWARGRVRSGLTIETSPISKTFQGEIDSLGLNTAIKIRLDRANHKVRAEIDREYIVTRVDSLMEIVREGPKNKKEMALHPIFMTSVKRDFKPNLLLKQLCEANAPNNFLIFLFVEESDAEFYANMIKENFQKVCQGQKLDSMVTLNPIIPGMYIL